MSVRRRGAVLVVLCMVAAVGAGTGCDRARTASPVPPGGSPSQPNTLSRSAAQRLVPARPGGCVAHDVLATWSLTRLAQQTVVVPVRAEAVASVTPQVAAGAGGVILFGSHAPATLGSSLARLVGRAPGGIAPFVMTDEEGGAVQRMPNVTGGIPSARQMAATMTPAQIGDLALRAGRRMRAEGVTMDLAPVLDLDGGPGPDARNPDGTRSFSTSATTATAAGLGFAAGLTAAGLVPVVKHFPGLGGATGNTDVTPASTVPWSTLQGHGLVPFATAVREGVPAIMVANARIPGLTDLPASLSRTLVTGVLRQRMGFTGLVLTDSLSATAISAAGYPVPRASVQALAAGADMVLYDAEAGAVAGLTTRVVQAIVAAVQAGQLPRSRLQEAVLHVLTAKHVDLCR